MFSSLEKDWQKLFEQFAIYEHDFSIYDHVDNHDEPVENSQTEAEQEQAKEATFSMAEKWLSRGFKLFFDNKFPNWEVSDQEIQELASLYAELFTKYCPNFSNSPLAEKVNDFVEGVGLEIKILIMTWQLIKSRKGIPAKIELPLNGNGSTEEKSHTPNTTLKEV